LPTDVGPDLRVPVAQIADHVQQVADEVDAVLAGGQHRLGDLDRSGDLNPE
jgi:hypothetical protein